MNESDVRERIKQILIIKEVSVNKLAGYVTTEQVRINNQINKTTTISTNTLLLVLSTFPDVSAEWLLRGEGSMYRDGKDASPNVTMKTTSGGQLQVGGSHNSMRVQADANACADIIKIKDEQIADLKEDKANLMALLTALSTK